MTDARRSEGPNIKKAKVASSAQKKRRHSEIAKWFAEIDRLRGDQLFPNGRNQPKPPRRKFFDKAQGCKVRSKSLALKARSKSPEMKVRFKSPALKAPVVISPGQRPGL